LDPSNNPKLAAMAERVNVIMLGMCSGTKTNESGESLDALLIIASNAYAVKHSLYFFVQIQIKFDFV
jgi:hypothetical protein